MGMTVHDLMSQWLEPELGGPASEPVSPPPSPELAPTVSPPSSPTPPVSPSLSASSGSSPLPPPLLVSSLRGSSPSRFTDLDRTTPLMLRYLDTMSVETNGLMTRFLRSSPHDSEVVLLREGFVKLLNNPRDEDPTAGKTRTLLKRWFKYLSAYWEAHTGYITSSNAGSAPQSPEAFASYWLETLLIGSTTDLAALRQLREFVVHDNSSVDGANCQTPTVSEFGTNI